MADARRESTRGRHTREERMIQQAIGLAVGALVSLVLLMLTIDNVEWNAFVLPLVIGAIAAFFWPVVIGIWLGRRARARRDNQIESEVNRQLDQRNQGR
jgi:hypothetical protein